MASRRGLAAIVACALLLAACTGAIADTDPTAPPGVFAPTPSIGDESAPTTTARPEPSTTIDVERTVIYPVDPLTLEALPGFEPIPMGDWMWGQPSSNGNYFAAFVGSDDGVGELRLIDVVNWKLEGSWRESQESEVHVTDEGTVYFISSGQVHRLRSGYSRSEEVGRLPAGFNSWGSIAIIHEASVVFGSRNAADQMERASIVSVDLTTGTVTEFELPEVRIGPVDPDAEEPWAGYLYTTPSLIWDKAGARGLVVHGDEDVVSEIDLASGVVAEHSFAADDVDGADSSSMLRRSMALSPDGRYLFLSGQTVAEMDGDVENWTVSMAPAGVMSIDTTTWRVENRVEQPIAEVHLSPAGDRILASGYTTVEGNTTYSQDVHGMFVLDSATLEVVAHYPSERLEQWYGPFSFNQEAGAGYVTVQRGGVSVEVIDLASGQILAETEGDEYVDMIGSIGVLSATISP